MIAEIADKMPTIPQLWLWAVFLSVPFVVVAFRVRGKLGSLVILCLAGGFSAYLGYGAAKEAFYEGSFSEAVAREMGNGWISHSITSSFVPLVITAVVVALRRTWTRRDLR